MVDRSRDKTENLNDDAKNDLRVNTEMEMTMTKTTGDNEDDYDDDDDVIYDEDDDVSGAGFTKPTSASALAPMTPTTALLALARRVGACSIVEAVFKGNLELKKIFGGQF